MKNSNALFECSNCGLSMGPKTQSHLINTPDGEQEWTCSKPTPSKAPTSGASHTPTLEVSVMRDQDNNRYLVMRNGVLLADCGKGNSAKVEAERIVRAVNSFEALTAENARLLNAHEELLKAMRKAVKDIESAMNTHTFPPSCGIPMENAKVVLELAIAKAEATEGR